MSFDINFLVFYVKENPYPLIHHQNVTCGVSCVRIPLGCMSDTPQGPLPIMDVTISVFKALTIHKIRMTANWKKQASDKEKFNWKLFDKGINTLCQNNILISLTIPNYSHDWVCPELKNS